MTMQDLLSSSPANDENAPRYRSGAVARMVRMPVATLRIWERRYRVASPATTPSGHRLYSAADVQRIALLKQLTDHGHAIGSIAALDMEALRRVAATHASTLAEAAPAARPGVRALRVVLVGAAWTPRLQRPALQRALGRPLEVLGRFDGLAQAAAAPDPAGPRADALLLQAAGLHEGALAEVQATASAWGAGRVVVLYGYAPAPVLEALAAAGMVLLREPQDDSLLAACLRGLGGPDGVPGAGDGGRDAAAPGSGAIGRLGAGAGPVAPRRYDDAALTDIAGLSSTLACECPRHLAELLMQLSHFEAYSAECRHRSPADAALHAHLQQVAGTARSMFESALEQVALQEGLILPRPGSDPAR